MRFFKRLTFLFFVFLVFFIIYTLVSSGFFRKIEPKFEGEIFKKVALTGAEDIMVSEQDSFALVSSTHRAPTKTGKENEDNLYLIDLKTNEYLPTPLVDVSKLEFSPHGISYFKKDSSYQVMAINHTEQGHSIEVFELRDKKMEHLRTIKDASMIRPNDLVMIDENRFYYTNDHGYTKGLGKILEEYAGLALSKVIYFDGYKFREVAKGIAYANGINYDPKRSLVFVASARKFLVKVYAKNEDGTLSFIEDIACGTGVDNIDFDKEGNLLIGCHPNLLWYSAYSKGDKEISPSEIIKIDYRSKGDYTIETIYLEDGTEMSGSTVAVPFGDLLFVGNVMDDSFLILKQD